MKIDAIDHSTDMFANIIDLTLSGFPVVDVHQPTQNVHPIENFSVNAPQSPLA